MGGSFNVVACAVGLLKVNGSVQSVDAVSMKVFGLQMEARCRQQVFVSLTSGETCQVVSLSS